MKTRRIMWLINHTTLRAFEVPLLIDMGYEVFCPKSFPYNEGNLSASVEWKYDDTLTIPKDDLDILKDAGKISHEIAIDKALSEFEKYRITQDKLFESDFDKFR